MGIVRLRSAKLIVGNWTAVGDVLQETAPAVIAKKDVELAVRSKAQDTTIVISPRRLTSVRLQGAQPDQVPIKRQS